MNSSVIKGRRAEHHVGVFRNVFAEHLGRICAQQNPAFIDAGSRDADFLAFEIGERFDGAVLRHHHAPSADEYDENFKSRPLERWRSAQVQSLTTTSASPASNATGAALLVATSTNLQIKTVLFIEAFGLDRLDQPRRPSRI